MAKEFECERDGVVIRGPDDDELVASVERHIAEAHPDLVRGPPARTSSRRRRRRERCAAGSR
jgi:hypothetical protein